MLKQFLFPKETVHSTIYRILEALALVLFVFYSIASLMAARFGYSQVSLITAIVAIILVADVSMLLADFTSGIVHFMGDTFGSPTTPFFGPNFIYPFREHHVDQFAITRHDFLDVNGSNLLFSLPLLIPAYYLIDPRAGIWQTILLTGVVFFLLFIFLTNQIHKWAHMGIEARPRWVSWIQRRGWILSPEHHSIHHTSPYDTYFCITAGWWNPFLEKIGVFKFLASKYKGQVVRPPFNNQK